MRARLSLQYGILGLVLLMGLQPRNTVAQEKRATPPSAKDLVGIWIGFDSDELTFTRLDLRPDSTGFCARVSPADTILHHQGVHIYRITKWSVNGWNIEIEMSPVSNATGVGYVKGRVGLASLKLTIGGPENGAWDSHFIGLPVVNPKKQNRPTRTAKEIEKIIAASRSRYRVLYSLLAGTGLRIGEALALKIGQHISDYCSTIHVRQSLWRGKEQEPKTQAAVRDVDITRELAALLAKFIGDRKDGYLFCTETGKPLPPRNILRDSLHSTLAKLEQPKMGFHCFRRFRESVLQKSEARALLVDYWMGHENREMGTRYAKQLVEDVGWRKQWAKKVGLGFKLTDLQLEVGQLGQLSTSKTQPAKAA